ncbi:apyrase 2 [Perilla frutescens var. hirtella]|nr:apyrase 2 [Perilla frutescens var. hirtella]
MAYAVSESAKVPKVSGGEESYVQQMYLKGRKYHLYIHSSRNISMLSSSAGILVVKMARTEVIVGESSQRDKGVRNAKREESMLETRKSRLRFLRKLIQCPQIHAISSADLDVNLKYWYLLTSTISTYELGHQPEANNPQLLMSIADNKGYCGTPLEYVKFK